MSALSDDEQQPRARKGVKRAPSSASSTSSSSSSSSSSASSSSSSRKGKRSGRRRDDDDDEEYGGEEQRFDDDDEDDDDDDDDDGEDNWAVDVVEGEEKIQVDLDVMNLDEDDYFALKHFLTGLLDGKVWLASDVAHHLSEDISEHIGSTIRVDGGREPYGLMTVLNLHRTASMAATREIVSFLLEKVTHKEQNAQLRQIFKGEQSAGLVINERMVNVPYQIAPPMHLGFWEELEEAAQGEAKAYFDMEYYLMLTTVFEETSLDDAVPRSKKGRDASTASLHYIKPEDEIYLRNSRFAFSYPLPRARHGRWTIGGTIKERRVIVLFHKSAIPKIVSELQQFVDHPESFLSAPPALPPDEFVNPVLESSE